MANLVSFIAAQSGTSWGSGDSSFELVFGSAAPSNAYTNLGSGTPGVSIRAPGSSETDAGRFVIKKTGAVAGADALQISQEGASGQVIISAINYAGGQTNRLQIQRSITTRGSLPSSGAYQNGDYIINSSVSELGVLGSKYVIMGWSRLTTGSAHVLNTDWVECRALTGN
jgi:hypothetical protein